MVDYTWFDYVVVIAAQIVIQWEKHERMLIVGRRVCFDALLFGDQGLEEKIVVNDKLRVFVYFGCRFDFVLQIVQS